MVICISLIWFPPDQNKGIQRIYHLDTILGTGIMDFGSATISII